MDSSPHTYTLSNDLDSFYGKIILSVNISPLSRRSESIEKTRNMTFPWGNWSNRHSSVSGYIPMIPPLVEEDELSNSKC